MAKKMVITGSTVSAQQLKDLFRQIADGGITNLHMQAFLERRNPFTKAESSPTTFLTADYFFDRPYLFRVSEEFTSSITAAYPSPLVLRGLKGVENFELKMDSYDHEIVAQMGGEENVRRYAFTPDQIATVIDLQPEGVAGKLLTKSSNIFYVVGVNQLLFPVEVFWCDYFNTWGVDVGEFFKGPNLLQEHDWRAGCCVFRNTHTF